METDVLKKHRRAVGRCPASASIAFRVFHYTTVTSHAAGFARTLIVSRSNRWRIQRRACEDPDMKRLLTTRSKIFRQHLKREQGTRSGIFFVSFYSATCLSLGDLVRRCPGQPVDLLAPWPPAAVIPRRRSIAVHFQSVTQSLVVRRPKPPIVTSRCHQRWTSKRQSQSTENLISMRFLLVGKLEVRPFGRNERVLRALGRRLSCHGNRNTTSGNG